MSDQDSVVSPEDILITPAMYQRPQRDGRLDTELAAYRELSSLMTVDPELAIQRFLELALELCPAAGSAGLSELATDDDGAAIFKWTAMAGEFAPYLGGTTPRDFSPCGLCLDHHHSILLERPARLFTYFNDAEPEIVEGLIVPLYDTGKRPLGTLWVTSHSAERLFDATDARIMEQLAVQLVLAIKLRRKAEVLVDLEQLVRDRDVLVQEVNHRVKNTIQMTSALLHLQERGVSSKEARSALKEAQSRLLVLAKVYEALLHPEAGGDLGSVDMQSLLKTLTEALSATIQKKPIEIICLCEPVRLETSLAVPVGLIVNEAVTNALKHGFPRGRSGTIHVELSMAAESCTLRVRDNGVGFQYPLRDGSLGMRLIQSLSRQLGSRLMVKGDAGTTIELSWPLAQPSSRAPSGRATEVRAAAEQD